jgi:SAM-dependent methyltransferase
LPDAWLDALAQHAGMSTIESSESFQITHEIAEFYETAFVPAFFAQWAPILCQAADVAPGHRVLDVACGTGIVTRTAADRVAPGGRTVGVDLNEAMLSVARRVRPDIEFRRADAARFADLAVRHAGDEARSLLSTYFVCGDLNRLASLVESTGLQVATARTEVGTYRAPSVDAFVTTEVESTPLVQRISPDVYAKIRTGAHHVLAPFTTADGRVEAPFESNLVVAHRR